jgi:hypothetical protein
MLLPCASIGPLAQFTFLCSIMTFCALFCRLVEMGGKRRIFSGILSKRLDCSLSETFFPFQTKVIKIAEFCLISDKTFNVDCHMVSLVTF